jgi:dUTP pyrophosphatase
LLVNLSQQPVVVQPGDRVAQMVIAPVLQAAVEEVAELSNTQRGGGGFGHTG